MKRNIFVIALFVCALLLVLLGHGMGAQAAYTVYYVTETGGGDCSSWANACDLQYALSQVEATDEIWVAAGTYLPITCLPCGQTELCLKDR